MKAVLLLKCLEERKKMTFTLQMKDLVLHFLKTDLGHVFGRNVFNEIGVVFRGEELDKPKFAYDVVRRRSLMVYTNLIEYNLVGVTKAPLQCYFLSFSKLRAGDIMTTGRHVNYKTFSNLLFRLKPKIFYPSNHIELRDTSVEKILFESVGVICLVLMFTRASNIQFT